MSLRPLIAVALIAGSALPSLAQESAPTPPTENPAEAPRPMRNAPSPRALELAAYVFAASNVCGYPIGVPELDALLAKQNTRTADVSPRGPFGARVQGMFAMMSNDMALHREQSCIAVANEYGPEGTVAKNVLKLTGDTAPPPDAKPAESKPAESKPAEPAPAK